MLSLYSILYYTVRTRIYYERKFFSKIYNVGKVRSKAWTILENQQKLSLKTFTLEVNTCKIFVQY